MEKKYTFSLEKRIFLVLIPFINLVNYYLTYNNIRFSLRTILTFSIDVAEGYLAWFTIHLIIIYLHRSMLFSKNPLKRLGVQMITTWIAGVAVVIILTLVTNYLFSNQPVPTSFFSYDLIIISVWVPVINGIYIGLFFYKQWHQAEAMRASENKVRTGALKVKAGRRELLLNYEDIAGFQVDSEYIVCHTLAGKKYLLDQSMDSLEKSLPTAYFFRLNRKILVHHQVIAGFEKADYGKLNVLFKSIYLETFSANVSRIKAAAFKDWLQPLQVKASQGEI